MVRKRVPGDGDNVHRAPVRGDVGFAWGVPVLAPALTQLQSEGSTLPCCRKPVSFPKDGVRVLTVQIVFKGNEKHAKRRIKMTLLM